MTIRRVMILGSPASGKSSLARALGTAGDLPVFHLDRLYHAPGWQPRPAEAFAADVERIAALPAWVIDGNYSRVAAPRTARADLIVFLHIGRGRAVWRAFWRAVRGFGRQRADAAPGCAERIDPAFLRYVWRWPVDVAPRVRAIADGFAGRVVHVRTPTDRVALIAEISAGTGATPPGALHAAP